MLQHLMQVPVSIPVDNHADPEPILVFPVEA